MTIRISLCLVLVASVTSPAWAQSRTTGGAAVGGAAGAIIGGIIGHQNDETPEGALIGGAVGAITGGLLGRAQDNQIAQQRAYQAQAYHQGQQQAYVQQQTIAASGVSTADVVSMSRSGISDAVIMNHLQSKGVQRRLEVSDIIALHQQGVSDTLITVMQQAPLATQLATPMPTRQTVVVQQPNVIVREQPVIYRSPVVVEEYYRSYPVHRHYHHGRSMHFGF
jgi:outer membrane lipoprotein SlyB